MENFVKLIFSYLLFLRSIYGFIQWILNKFIFQYHNMTKECLRFNSCLFVRLILHHIGTKIQLENSICDLIQDAMVERTMVNVISFFFK